MGVLDIIAAAKPGGRRTVDIILGADLDAQWRELQNSLDDAARADERDGSLAQPFPNTTRVVDELEAIREQVEAATLTFTFEPMDWADRLDLQAFHAPREGNLLDLARGYNVTTFVPAVIRAAFAKVTDPSGDEATELPDERWTALLGPVKKGRPILSLRQVDDMFAAADQQNTETLRVPTSARFLLGSQDSEASSTPRGPGKARPRSGGGGGSRRTSPKSSTTSKATPSKARSADT